MEELMMTANFLLEQTVERLHYQRDYADRDLGSWTNHVWRPCDEDE